MIMKIWREDITKDILKKGSVNMACAGILFAILTEMIIYFPRVAVIVCGILAVIAIIISMILSIKATTLKK